MSVLTRKEIVDSIKLGELKFEPNLDGFQMQPHAVDLRLGYTFYIPRTWHMTKRGREALTVDPLDLNGHESNFEMIKVTEGQYFELLPKEFIIGTTLEKMHINRGDIMAILYPRSSVNRRGLSVDLSGVIDVWYKGNLMIPIINNTETQTIRVYPGERICQVTFQTLDSRVDEKDAQKHGLSKAKYHYSSDVNINRKPDKADEVKLIKSGKIKELKQKYEVNL